MIKENTPMNKELQIILLKQRKALLQARGPHNDRLVAKIDRQIRKLEND
jgi:hypothetical protein